MQRGMEEQEHLDPAPGGSGGTPTATSVRKRTITARKSSKRNEQGIFKKMRPISAYFGTPPISTEPRGLTEPHVSNEISDANNLQAHVHEPEVSNEQTANEGFDANNLHTPVPEHEVSNQGSNANILQATIQGFSRADIEPDPGLRKQIGDYSTPEIRDAVRREYLKKGPSQPYGHAFPRNTTTDNRVFREEWFKDFDWLEYSVEKNRAYCFHCFLFKQSTSHVTLIRFHQMWDSVIQVLHAISHDGEDADDRGKASGLMKSIEQLRDEGWEPLLEAVTSFCIKREIPVPAMNENISARGYPRSSRKMVSCFHHYKIEIFNEVLDRNIAEMNNRFSETSTRLLICIASLDPRDSFSRFNHENLLELASIYSVDFDPEEQYHLDGQLKIYIDMMKRSPTFCGCDSLANLALKLVETKEHLHFPLVYRLIKLALTLPVATASVERVFSVMNIIKTDLRNKIGDDWLNDMMICYVERDIFAGIDDKQIIVHFHGLRDRRGHLPQPPRIITT